jgi:hypothetical protein
MAFSASHPPRDAPADLGNAAPPQGAERHRWWHDAENADQDLLRVLITSPWQRYLLDRDAAEPDEGSLSR